MYYHQVKQINVKVSQVKTFPPEQNRTIKEATFQDKKVEIKKKIQ